MLSTWRHVHALARVLLCAGLCLAWLASGAAELQEGRDWRPLSPPQPVADAERIEVLEFFSYGCPHCAHLNPLAKEWAKKLPEDVAFQRVPVTFGRTAWANLARLFYTLEFEKTLEQVDDAVFDAVIERRENLSNPRTLFTWIEKQGLDREAFEKTFNGFAVETALRKAEILSERYQVDAVPRIVVDGRYVVVGAGASDYAALLSIADRLIDKARARRAATN